MARTSVRIGFTDDRLPTSCSPMAILPLLACFLPASCLLLACSGISHALGVDLYLLWCLVTIAHQVVSKEPWKLTLTGDETDNRC
ncbi:hypothetical protein BN1723_002787, partial [Verticillium longisporum]